MRTVHTMTDNVLDISLMAFQLPAQQLSAGHHPTNDGMHTTRSKQNKQNKQNLVNETSHSVFVGIYVSCNTSWGANGHSQCNMDGSICN